MQIARGAAIVCALAATSDLRSVARSQQQPELVGTVGRLSPSYCIQDGVVPRTRLPHVLRRIVEISAKHQVRIVNVVHAGDADDVLDVRLDRADRKTQRVGNLTVGVPEHDQPQHVLLAVRQRCDDLCFDLRTGHPPQQLQYQIGLFILALAPVWTSFTTRSVAWAYPLMGSHGALNYFLTFLGVSSLDKPLIDTEFTQLSVQLAMIQLYILFMVTPIFFLLAQVDRHALEAARDLGGNWWSTFREVILPQTMPGIVIGSIFIFVLTMGEYGTVEVISQGAVTTVGVYVHSQIVGTQYPQGAASAVLLVFVLILGVFGIMRFSNLREDI